MGRLHDRLTDMFCHLTGEKKRFRGANMHNAHEGFGITDADFNTLVEDLEKAMDDLCQEINQAVRDGYNVVVLSDRGVNKEWAPIPSLLAVAGVHHHLIREGSRTQVGLVLEDRLPMFGANKPLER